MAEKIEAKKILIVLGDGRELRGLEDLDYSEIEARASEGTYCNAFVEGTLSTEGKGAAELIAEMTKLRDDFDQRFPALKAWRESLKLEPLKLQVLDIERDPLIGHLRFYDQPVMNPRAALGDMLHKWLAASLLEPERKPIKLVAFEHDRVVVDVPVRDRRFNQRHRENSPRNPFPPASPFKRSRR